MASAGGPDAERPHPKPFLIGVSGGTASGKVRAPCRGRAGRPAVRPAPGSLRRARRGIAAAGPGLGERRFPPVPRQRGELGWGTGRAAPRGNDRGPPA